MKPEYASDWFKFIFGRISLLAKQKEFWLKKNSLANFLKPVWLKKKSHRGTLLQC